MDPFLAAIGSNDYHLLPASSAINAGSGVYAPQLDFDLFARPINVIVDIGADEFDGATVPAQPALIPAVSAWALIALALMLAVGGMVIGRKRLAPS